MRIKKDVFHTADALQANATNGGGKTHTKQWRRAGSKAQPHSTQTTEKRQRGRGQNEGQERYDIVGKNNPLIFSEPGNTTTERRRRSRTCHGALPTIRGRVMANQNSTQEL